MNKAPAATAPTSPSGKTPAATPLSKSRTVPSSPSVRDRIKVFDQGTSTPATSTKSPSAMKKTISNNEITIKDPTRTDPSSHDASLRSPSNSLQSSDHLPLLSPKTSSPRERGKPERDFITLVNSLALKIPLRFRLFLRNRVLPLIAAILVLHIMSPKLSYNFWFFLFRQFRAIMKIRQQKQLVLQSKQKNAPVLGGFLMPFLIICSAVLLFSQSTPERRVRTRRSLMALVGGNDSESARNESSSQVRKERSVNKLNSVKLAANVKSSNPVLSNVAKTTPKSLKSVEKTLEIKDQQPLGAMSKVRSSNDRPAIKPQEKVSGGLIKDTNELPLSKFKEEISGVNAVTSVENRQIPTSEVLIESSTTELQIPISLVKNESQSTELHNRTVPQVKNELQSTELYQQFSISQTKSETSRITKVHGKPTAIIKDSSVLPVKQNTKSMQQDSLVENQISDHWILEEPAVSRGEEISFIAQEQMAKERVTDLSITRTVTSPVSRKKKPLPTPTLADQPSITTLDSTEISSMPVVESPISDGTSKGPEPDSSIETAFGRNTILFEEPCIEDSNILKAIVSVASSGIDSKRSSGESTLADTKQSLTDDLNKRQSVASTNVPRIPQRKQSSLNASSRTPSVHLTPPAAPQKSPMTKVTEFEDNELFVASLNPDVLNKMLYNPTDLPKVESTSLTGSHNTFNTAKQSPRYQHSIYETGGSIFPNNTGLFVDLNARSLAYGNKKIVKLPTNFTPLLCLTRLHLSGNSITELPESFLSGLPALKFLDISNNKIDRLGKGLGQCMELRELYARNCGMSIIEEGILEELRSLEVLDLSGNRLAYFSPFAFAYNTSSLHTLILSNNNLKTLPPSLGLHRGRELVFLLITGNPFEPSIKVFTEPILATSQPAIARVAKELSQRMAIIPDEAAQQTTGLGLGIFSINKDNDQNSLYSWENDNSVQRMQDAEFDSQLQGYAKPESHSRLRRRSSMPGSVRGVSNKSSSVGIHPSSNRDAEAISTTSFHASTNPSYVYVQRLLSHLRDVFDLVPLFRAKRPVSGAVQTTGSRPSSKDDLRIEGFSKDIGEDPDAPDLTDEQRERIRKRQSPTRRAYIVGEILSTEITYVRELKALISLYADPLERGILTATDIGALFSNLKSILYFHKSTLLPNIERACQDPNQPIGAVFAEASQFFKQYSVYYNNFDTANEMVMHLEQLANSGSGQLQNPIHSFALFQTSLSSSSSQASRRTLAKKYKNLVKIAKNSPAHTQISLQSYLILPVQRLPRYKLLLEQLLESTPLNHPDKDLLKFATETVRDCVAECNDKKRETEEYERGMKQMSRIRLVKGKAAGSIASLMQLRQRRFVRETSLRVVKYVERLQSAEKSLDLQYAMVGGRDRFFKTAIGSVIEARFAQGVGATAVCPPVGVVGKPHLGMGLDALCIYGLQRTVGGEFRFLLFSDVLCWCKTTSGTTSALSSGSSIMDTEFDLIRVMDVGPNTIVEAATIISSSDQSPSGRFEQSRSGQMGPGIVRNAPISSSSSNLAAQLPITTQESESILRLSDNDCVLYLRGSQSEIEGLMETLKGLGCDSRD